MVDEQDRMLPIANVGRIMKQMLPPAAKISKEAKQTMQECATEFVSFVTGEASEKCQKENRKTVNGDDICWALSALGFDEYARAMVRYLHRYRELERDKSSSSSVAADRLPGDGRDRSPVRRSSEELFLGINRNAPSSSSSPHHQQQQQKERDRNVVEATPLGSKGPPTLMEFRIINEKNL